MKEQAEETPVAEVAAPAPSPAVLRAPGAMSPAAATQVASRVGNAAFGRLLRAPRTAADAPPPRPGWPRAGTSKELRDELDDTFVDEDKCLRLLGQLGDGERVLVGRDAAMMQQMADAFNAGEMGQAIERVTLDGEVADALAEQGRAASATTTRGS